jgi:DNA-binding CsgD family transcriptional regulator
VAATGTEQTAAALSATSPTAIRDRRGAAALLLERDRELAELERSLAAVAAGGGRLVVVEGAPGIGKTRLLREAGERAASTGLSVLSARGGELEREFGFGVVRQLVEPALAGAQQHERAAVLDGAARFAKPALEQGVHEVEGAGNPSHAVLHGLYWVIANLAERRPLLVTVDDAQWADLPSLRFLAFLARRLAGLRALLLLAVRPGHPTSGESALRELAHHPDVRLLAPRALSDAAVTTLVRGGLDHRASGELCRACHEATGGNPFLVGELLIELGREEAGAAELVPQAIERLGPQRIASAVLLRAGRLAGPATALARAVAILGEDAELRHAATLAGVGYEQALGAADALAAADVLRPGEPLRFRHPLIRTSIYEDIPAAQRSELHARAARLLGDDGAPSERVALHLLRGPRKADPWCVERLREEARRCGARGAAESAIGYLRRALDEPPSSGTRGELLAELGSVELLTDGPAAERHLDEALGLLGDHGRRAEVSEARALALFFARRGPESKAVAREALAELGDGEPERRSRLEGAMLNAALHDPRLTAVARELSGRVGTAGRAQTVGERGLAALAAWRDARAGDPNAIERAREALGEGELLAQENGGAPMLAAFILVLADRDEGLETFEAGLALANREGSVFAFACNKVFMGRARHLRGDLGEALGDLSEALEGSAAAGHAIGATWAASFLADVLLDRGDVAAAARVLDHEQARDGDLEDAHAHWLHDSRARLLIAGGELRHGLEATLDCGRRFEAVDGENPAFMAWRSRAALALLALGERREEARRLALEEVELARVWGAPRALGAALRSLGLVEGGGRGLELLQEAVEVLRGSPAQLEHARALVDLGAALRRAGRRRGAREALAHGLDLAHRCEAPPLTTIAHEELRAAGARPRRPAVRGVDSLTTGERRVADLAAQGATNREIAQGLFVTVKTVEMHLRNAYRKLELSSRTELPAALHASGPSSAAPAIGQH